MRCASGARLPVQRRPDHLPAFGPGQLHVLRHWRTSCPASTTTPASARRLASRSSRRRIRTSVSTSRTSGRSTSSLTINAGRALRPAVARNDHHRHQQRVAADRIRLDAVGIAPHDRPRQRRDLLRSRAAARAGQRADVRWEYDRCHRAAPVFGEPVADAGRRADLSRTSCRPRFRW